MQNERKIMMLYINTAPTQKKKLSNCTVQLTLGGWVGPGGQSFFEDLVIFQNHDLKFIIFLLQFF